jgi:hypothetical protein
MISVEVCFKPTKSERGVTDIRVPNLEMKWKNKVPDTGKYRISSDEPLKKRACDVEPTVGILLVYLKYLTQIGLFLASVSCNTRSNLQVEDIQQDLQSHQQM